MANASFVSRFVSPPRSTQHSHYKIILNITDLDEVSSVLRKCQYAGINYYQLGLSLGLLARTLDVIKTNNKDDVAACLLECLSKWLNQADNVKRPSWYALINALRSIDENSVADGVDKEKHPACKILAAYQSQSIMDALTHLALLLSREGLLNREILLPTTSQVLLNSIKEAVCINYHNLEKFALILQKCTTTILDGDSILTEYRNIFGIRQTGEVIHPISSSSCSDIVSMRWKFASVMFDVSMIMADVPPLEHLKAFIRFANIDLRTTVSRCSNIVEVLELISDKCSLIDISHLEAIIEKFRVDKAKPIIQQYKEDIKKFCEEVPLRLCLDKFLSNPSQLLSETVTFVVDRNVDDCTLNDVRILIKEAFQEKSIDVRVVVIREGNSFTITCSFPLALSQQLIINARNSLELLKGSRVTRLTIGYCTVYSSASLTQVASDSSLMYTGMLEQMVVYSNMLLLEKDSILTEEIQQLAKKGKNDEDNIMLLTEQLSLFKTEKNEDEDPNLQYLLQDLSSSQMIENKREEEIKTPDEEMMPMTDNSEEQLVSLTAELTTYKAMSKGKSREIDDLKSKEADRKEEIKALQEKISSLSIQVIDKNEKIQLQESMDKISKELDVQYQLNDMESLHLFLFALTNYETANHPLIKKISFYPHSIVRKLELFLLLMKDNPSFLANLREVKRRQEEPRKVKGSVCLYNSWVYLHSPSSKQCQEVISKLEDNHKKIELVRSSPSMFLHFILPILKKKQTVRELWIEYTPLTADYLHALSLSTNHSLQELIIPNCSIDDKGVQVLCRDLRYNTTLYSLYLWNNPSITSYCAESLANLLMVNSTLSYLNLQHTLLSSSGVSSIIESLTTNTTLLTLVLDEQHKVTCMSHKDYEIFCDRLYFNSVILL